jgi:(heptosyl)LPS beta-1,4-glucosyltransferase
MSKISVVISAYNEEKMIKDCLESVRWADEIIVVDNQSNDNTTKIAKKYTKKVYSRPNNSMLNVNKNFGFTKATSDWILSLDADERITKSLKHEITKTLNHKITKSLEQEINGYRMARRNIIFGKEMKGGIWCPDYVTRLFRKDKGKFPEKHNHELLGVDGEVGTLKHHILHYNYNSIDQYLSKLQKQYLDHEVKVFITSKKKIHWYDAIRFPAEDFLKNFFARNGYKDGLHGLVLSMLQSFYMFLVFTKVWEKQKFWQYNSDDFVKESKTEFIKFAGDIKYWIKYSKFTGESNQLKKIMLKLFG